LKVLAIFGSPRKNRNSAQMLEAALDEFPEEADIHRIFLADFHFSACCATRDCLELGYGLESINQDSLAIRDSRRTGQRLVELYRLVYGRDK